MKFEKIRFFYSSDVSPAKQFACNNSKAVELLEALKVKGIETEAIDVAGKSEDDTFMDYHRAGNGPAASVRPVFGTKGSLAPDFGRTAPALLCYKNKEDNYPEEVFPRMDKSTSKIIDVEQALNTLLNVSEYSETDKDTFET
ncbi:MAG: hypothetical protein IEMM0003_0708 [bacterium]|nr:MAG: hypothetical protein IEMM0003_0708 [bacterium]